MCINGIYSSKKKISFSVPQGLKNGPILFNSYSSTIQSVIYESIKISVKLSFLQIELIIQARDKLSPGTKPGCLKSEENVKLFTYIYTKNVSEIYITSANNKVI